MIKITTNILIFLFTFSICSSGSDFEFNDDISIGIEEQLGSYIPLDAEFITSVGDTITIGQISDKPFILDVVYYDCPGVCHPLLTELLWAVDRIEMVPGKDFKVITLSFDQTETPELAAKWKKNYLESMKRDIPLDSWYFLTGDSLNIKKITESIGFNYEPKGGTYVHAGALLAVSPEGKISRYIYGSTFNPFDLKMALIDAQNEEVRPTSAKLLQYCFTYDPEGREYKLNITRIAGSVMMVGIFIFVAVLIFKKQKVKRYKGI